MSIQSKSVLRFLMVFALLWSGFISTLPAHKQTKSFTGKSGLTVKVITDDSMGVVHAQILVFYEWMGNPVVPYVTSLNVFNQRTLAGPNPLRTALKRLGSDIHVQQFPQYLLVKINFLPDKMSAFIQFLKAFYRNKTFLNSDVTKGSLIYKGRETVIRRKFDKSVSDFWNFYYQQKDWRQDLALRVAYNRLFRDHPLGNVLITTKSLKEISLGEIRTFYSENYNLSNSLVILKGDLKPHITFGLIESSFQSFKKREKKPSIVSLPKMNPQREVVVIDIPQITAPVLYWFDVIPSVGDDDYLSKVIGNHVLFGYPMGRIPQRASFFGIRILRHQVLSNYHKDISVHCNVFGLNSDQIERFIFLADRERRKMGVKKISRKEYLDAANYLYGSWMVKTAQFQHDFHYEIFNFLSGRVSGEYAVTSSLLQKISMAKLNQLAEKKSPSVIVIVGNWSRIEPHLNMVRPSVIRFPIVKP